MEATSGVLDGLLAGPSGDGAVRSLGERFQADLLRGTGTYEVPLSLPKGPNDGRPELSLRYSTGHGNGAFGLGWRLSGLLSIQRRLDTGVPSYGDDDEFQLGDGDLLVPVGDGHYRTSVDTQSWDVVRGADDDGGWVIRTKDGHSHHLGTTPGSRVAVPDGVFSWLLDRSVDPAGNEIRYTYLADGPVRYPETVEWGTHSLRFVYEERPDPIRDGRAGVLFGYDRRCVAIERRSERTDPSLVARHDLDYERAPGAGLSLLRSVRLTGVDDAGTEESYPALTFGYSTHDPGEATYRRVDAADRALPALDDPATTLVDMTGDGTPDVLRTGRGEHRYWPNRGDGSFGHGRSVPLAPAGMVVGEPGVTFADVNGDGAADLLDAGRRLSLAVTNTGSGGWSKRPTVYRGQLPLDVTGESTRLVDIDGDGRVDLLQSGRTGFLYAYQTDDGQWSRPTSAARRSDAPPAALDRKGVHLADVTGDGMADVAFVDSGRVEYWPSLGNGVWGARVRMQNPPRLPPRHDPDRLFLSDVDGDGTTDLVYVDGDRVRYWLNRSGVEWSDPYEVPFVPPPDVTTLHLVDLTGTGTRGLLWTAARRSKPSAYRYLDLTGGTKPYLLTSVENGLGTRTDVTVTTSTAMRAADAEAGEPWESYLPFPVHVVSEITERDRISGRERCTRMRYHRGYLDPVAREFRGFARVEVEHAGDEHTPGALQETEFFLGTALTPATANALSPAVRAEERALAGSPETTRTFELDADGGRTLVKSAAMSWTVATTFDDGERVSLAPRLERIHSRDHAPGEPDRIDIATYEYDAVGNVTRRRRKSRFEDQPEADALVEEERMAYTTSESDWLVGLPAGVERRDGDGGLLEHTRYYYDGAPFEGLPAGEATAGVLRRVRELVLADSALPDGYADEVDPDWGLVHEGEGFYRDTVAFDHDDHGNVRAQRDALGAERTVSYDTDGQFPETLTEPDGAVVRATFDHRTAQPAELTYPNGATSTFEYGALGRLHAQFDTAADGSLELTHVYDLDFGDAAADPPEPVRVVSVRPLSAGRTLADIDGRPPDDIDDARVRVDYYDGEGNLLQQLRRAADDPDGTPQWVAARRREYTVEGEPAVEYPNAVVPTPAYRPELPAAAETRFAYGPDGQLREVTLGDGGRLTARYFYNRIEKRPPHLDDGPPIVERYDARGNLVGVEQPDGDDVTSTAYAVDLDGRPLRVVDASGRVLIETSYAGPGRAVHADHADAGERTYWFDGGERLRRRLDGGGRRLDLRYDVGGRLLTATDATDPDDSVVVRELTYDGRELVRAREGDVETRYEYDALGRATRTEIAYPDGSTRGVDRTYDLQGELSTLRYPDGTEVAYERNPEGLPTALSGVVDHATYDAHGNPRTVRFAGDARTEYAFDAATGDIASAALATEAGVVRRVEFEYDAAGNIASLRDELPDRTLARRFHYDDLLRLTRAELREGSLDGTVVRDDGYAYTPTGDLTRNDESLDAMTYGDADHAGRLTAVRPAGEAESVPLAYDDAGRLRSFGGMGGLEYDVWDRLVAATLASGTTVRFAYDHHDRRVVKRVESADGVRTTRSVETLYEVDDDGTERLYVHLGRLLVAVRTWTPTDDETETAFVLTDPVGSVIAACTADGSVVHQQVYTPFGLRLEPGGDEHLDRFAGPSVDAELGLVQFGTRYYAPALGRFITPDWYVIENPERALRLPQGFNAYSYSGNNPLVYRDPTGRFLFAALLVIGAAFVVGFIAGTVYGLATGQGWNSLLVGLEAGLLAAAGTAIGVVGGAILGATLGTVFGGMLAGLFIGGVAGGIIGGLNGVISGMTQIYDWKSWTGWAAFLSDSSWGLLGTGLGLLVHAANIGWGDYDGSMSRRSNVHIYDSGFRFKSNFAVTMGNVVSNLDNRNGDLLDHEKLHAFQSRVFGPIYQVTYVAWFVVGTVVGIVAAPFTDQSIGDDILDVAYYNNPWETWAYKQMGPDPSGPDDTHGGTLSWT